ncbi:PilZ domain-containing protein [Chloroflexota bacterium]
MNNSNSSSQIHSQIEDSVERRRKPRVECSYPAQVNGYTSGMKFEARAILTNMSASGMYLRLKRRLEMSEPVFVVVRLSTSPLRQKTTPRIAANGSVVRIEPKSDGTYGVAVQLDNHRFP